MENTGLFDRLLRPRKRRPALPKKASPRLGEVPGSAGKMLVRGVGVLSMLASVSMASQFAASPVAAAGSLRIMGVVTVAPGAALPTSFRFRRANGMMATVNVPATSKILLRYGGPGVITAITAGDHLVLWGQFESGNTTFDATSVRDLNLERVTVNTHAVVSSVNATANSIAVHTVGYNNGSPLHGNLTIDVAAGATVLFPNGTTVLDTALRSGDVLLIGGLYNTRTHTLLSAISMRGVRLVSTAPVSLTPITLSLSGTGYQRQHYVTVRVHTVAHAFVRVILRFSGRQRVFTGRAGIRGYYTTRRLLAYGRWPRPRLVHATVFVSSGPRRAHTSTQAYIG